MLAKLPVDPLVHTMTTYGEITFVTRICMVVRKVILQWHCYGRMALPLEERKKRMRAVGWRRSALVFGVAVSISGTTSAFGAQFTGKQVIAKSRKAYK